MTETAVSGREPFEAVYIYQDLCTRTYGESPCTASLATGGRKCFNTLPTCQDDANYEKGQLILRFCRNGVEVPQDGNYWLPYLQSVRVTAGAINPGGADKNSSPLGRRATIDCTFSDHPHSDRYVDPYRDERVTGAAQLSGEGYDPFSRSTFWSKWKARNGAYYLGRKLVYVSGYLKDGQIVDAIEREFVITGFSGPTSSGAVSISGKDVLTRVANEKAKAPAFSEGKLVADIDDSVTSFSVTSGTGSEYPESGFVRVGDEVMAYTRTGDDFSVLRAQWNTPASSHSAGDRVQWCLHFDSRRADQIAYTLLHDYAGIPDESLDVAGWEKEVDTDQHNTNLYTALITEPTSVEELLSECCEQMYFSLWVDERESIVRLRTVRAPTDEDTIYELDDDQHLVADSVNAKDEAGQLITAVVVNFAMRNPARDLEEPANYGATNIVLSAEADPNRLGESRSRVIYSRWIPGVGGGAALELGQNIISQYSTIPRKVRFTLDAKDRQIAIGDYVQLTHRKFVNDAGEEEPLRLQVLSVSEKEPGHSYEYEAQQFNDARIDVKPVEISTSQNNLNLRDAYDAVRSVAPVAGDSIPFTIKSGVTIGSDSPDSPALTLGEWPEGVTLFLRIEAGAKVIGAGGAGGDGGSSSVFWIGRPGGMGGTALLVDRAIEIENLGSIYGGGGGGGGGGGAREFIDNYDVNGGGGGGGAGVVGGPGGEGGKGGSHGGTIAEDGESGTETTGGAGGDGTSRQGLVGGTGGAGGAPGMPGSNGEPGMDGAFEDAAGGAGGAPGHYADGYSFITWAGGNEGDVAGTTNG